MPFDFALSSETLPNGRTVHYAQLIHSGQDKFVIGYRTQFQGNFGLFNFNNMGQTYRPEDFEGAFPFWASFIFPTAKAESRGIYNCLNTYDRARFTFGFMQYAAHVPNGDFVKFFKKLLALGDGPIYFPKLVIKDGRIHYRNSNGTLNQLESDSTTEPLMGYLNPTLNEVENQELICSARMVHWSANHAEARDIQVECAIDHFRSNMKQYHNRFGLNNVPANVCQMICDIRHQGRGTNDRIANALNTGGDFGRAFDNLCTIGEANYASRIVVVRDTINALVGSGIFNKKYDSVTNSFVDISSSI
ncbi:MAG: hypothetical protein C0490_19415, partial [Marivirga sp.]|nr:hypothetical protein [Marivirga sp.]